MKRGSAPFISLLLILAAAACASETPAPRATGTKVRFVETGPKDVKSLPFHMAVDSLRGQGHSVEVLSVQSFDLVPDVLLRGDGEIGRISAQAAWTAIAKGAQLRAVVEANGSWEVVAARDIKSCHDLDGKGTAFGSTRGVNVAMFRRFIADHCPDAQPQLLVISNSSSRAAALLSGQVSAAQLELQDVFQLDRQAPGRFYTLLQTSKEFPHVAVFLYAVRQDWAQQHPDVVRAFIRAFLLAQRSVIDDPQRVRSEATARTAVDADDAEAIGDTYRTRRLWDANGGLSAARIQSSLEFLSAARAIPEGLKPDQVADLSYLNAVLDEIGRK
jgi:ABC-type nitrate/sulfonate/bicarbonate transport system substrate-binding protein